MTRQGANVFDDQTKARVVSWCQVDEPENIVVEIACGTWRCIVSDRDRFLSKVLL